MDIHWYASVCCRRPAGLCWLMQPLQTTFFIDMGVFLGRAIGVLFSGMKEGVNHTSLIAAGGGPGGGVSHVN